MALLTSLLVLLVSTAVIIGLIPFAFRLAGRLIGNSTRSKTEQRRELLLQRAANEDTKPQQQDETKKQGPSSTSSDEEWEHLTSGSKTPTTSPPTTTSQPASDKYSGIIAFFHPFCNAGGGGERVLFAALLATQHRYPHALCIVYTGDHDATKEQILTNAANRFNIHLNPTRISFLYLSTREWVLASRWPHFTLLGQSLGSLVLGWDALNLLVPDVMVDTMGYSFVLALVKWLFPKMPVGAYVHYPTISTDMLESLNDENTSGHGLNAGMGKDGLKGKAKFWYWHLFARLYSWVGGHVDVVMTNSTWTQRHISTLWSPARRKRGKRKDITVLYPPCAVEELQQKIPVSAESEKSRTRNLLYIAQFRPEKCHQLIIDAFIAFLKTHNPTTTSSTSQPKPKLILAGSVRDSLDERLVYKLRLQAQEVKENVEFVINAKWERLLQLLGECSVGVNGMWNEHFGIGVVEYQAAGLISVVNDSGGPKYDIVVDMDGRPTGFHASSVEEFAQAFRKALELGEEETVAMRLRARNSALRFSEEVFRMGWVGHLEGLVEMGREWRGG